ncbi:hypothetical protein VTN00DRAFT_4916 [Thermoascus crustaceus]|uniref:uncharacterized protein n=1 Tax=Thermoascus crustaceus TaxID=5088 RepID=UPI0037426605
MAPPSCNYPVRYSPRLGNLLNISGEHGSQSPPTRLPQDQRSPSANSSSGSPQRGRGASSSRGRAPGPRSRASSSYRIVNSSPKASLSSQDSPPHSSPPRSTGLGFQRMDTLAFVAAHRAPIRTESNRASSAAGTSTPAPSTAAAACRQQQSQSQSRPTRHTVFVEVKIHTAKCDICNNHNKAVLRRCKDCGWQICTPCWHARGGDGSHGTRRPFTGEIFNPEPPHSPLKTPEKSKKGDKGKGKAKDKDTCEDVVMADAAGVKDHTTRTKQRQRKTSSSGVINLSRDDDYEYQGTAESPGTSSPLRNMGRRELRPRQKRNYVELLSDIEEEQENEDKNDDSTLSMVENSGESAGDTYQATTTTTTTPAPAAPATPKYRLGQSHQLEVPESEGERRWFYLLQAANEAYQELLEEERINAQKQNRSPLFLSTDNDTLRSNLEPSTPATPATLSTAKERSEFTSPLEHKSQKATGQGTKAQLFSRKSAGAGHADPAKNHGHKRQRDDGDGDEAGPSTRALRPRFTT